MGYLSRENALRYRQLHGDEAIACRARVSGGGSKKNYGIWLDFQL